MWTVRKDKHRDDPISGRCACECILSPFIRGVLLWRGGLESWDVKFSVVTPRDHRRVRADNFGIFICAHDLVTHMACLIPTWFRLKWGHWFLTPRDVFLKRRIIKLSIWVHVLYMIRTLPYIRPVHSGRHEKNASGAWMIKLLTWLTQTESIDLAAPIWWGYIWLKPRLRRSLVGLLSWLREHIHAWYQERFSNKSL